MMHYTSMAFVRTRLAPLMILVAWLAGTMAVAAEGDPPARVARVDILEGSGAMQASGTDAWTGDLLNRPLTGGDRIWIDERSRAEIHIGSTALRLGARTAVQILEVDDHHVRLALTAGSLSVRLRYLEADDGFDIDTLAGLVSLVQPGGYRLDVDDRDARAYLAVWSGRAEVSGPSGTSRVRDNESAELIAGSEPAIETSTAGNTDSLDLWAEDRDRLEDQSRAADYVSREVVGYQDLDSYGEWVSEPAYGMVWVPVVVVGWAPYRYGYWNWIAPWGWTWIANEPWGFAPCHYGRWVHARHGWAWAPGEREWHQPVYAPALVAWRADRYPKPNSGPDHTPRVGWIPLGFNEVYDPPFHASRDYVRATNLSNTHLGHGDVERLIDDRQRPERRYVNDTVPGAYTAAPREAFTSANSFGPRHTPAEPNKALQAIFAPHELRRTAPADRPLVRQVNSSPVMTAESARVQSGTRMQAIRSPPPPAPRRVDRPLPQMPTVVARTPQAPYLAPPGRRESQPVPRAAVSPQAPARGAVPSAAPANTVVTGGREARHVVVVRPDRQP